MQPDIESEMSNSNAFDDLKRHGEAQVKKKEYNAVAVNIITALESHGSDSVRDALNEISDFGFFHMNLLLPLRDIFISELSNCGDDDDAKAKYLYGVPFFCRPEETEATTKNNRHDAKMSGGVTTSTTRVQACFKESIHFQIYFDHFDVDKELNLGVDGSDLQNSQTKTVIDGNVSEKFAEALRESFKRFRKRDIQEFEDVVEISSS